MKILLKRTGSHRRSFFLIFWNFQTCFILPTNHISDYHWLLINAQLWTKQPLVIALSNNFLSGNYLIQLYWKPHNSKLKEGFFSPPPGFEPWSPGTWSQCATNQLCWPTFRSIFYVWSIDKPLKIFNNQTMVTISNLTLQSCTCL